MKQHTEDYKLTADKVIGWKLYPERKGGVKTADILEF